MQDAAPATIADLSACRPPSTPVLVLHRGALERNLARMQDACDAAGVRLRAHGKTHKCSALGRLQVARGAVGLCAQTVGEAEAFAAGGIADILVTAPSPAWAVPRIAALAAEGRRIGAVADDGGQVARLGVAAQAAGVVLDLIVDIDLGQHRAGVPPEAAPALARQASETPGLRWAGLQAYMGHLQHLAPPERRREAVDDATGRLAALVGALAAAGLPAGVVTGGGTGTYASDLAAGVFTELQAGSYAVMDVEYDDCGPPEGADWTFEPALAIAAAIVSARHATHAVCDAGLKAVSVDGPPARVLAGAAPGSLWRSMGDEHGAIFHPAALPVLKAAGRDPLAFAQAVTGAAGEPPADAPRVGDLVWLQPGHCDPTVNLYDAFLVLEPDGGLTRWPIDARRKTPEPA